MKTYQVLKQIGLASIVWIIAFVADYVIELFHIDQTSTIITALGLRIETTMTEHELNTNFAITSRAVVIYLIFICLWTTAYYCITKHNKTKNK